MTTRILQTRFTDSTIISLYRLNRQNYHLTEELGMRNSKVLARLRSNDFARICALGHFLPFFIRHPNETGRD